MVKVTAAVLVDNGRVLIARRKPTLKLADMWEFPGGKIEGNETPEACLRREMKEEFDIDVTVGEYLGSNVHRYGFGTIELMGYRVFFNSGEWTLTDHSRIEWVTVDRLGEFAFTPADLFLVSRIQRGEIKL